MSASSSTRGPARCAIHPARPAHDACPRCGRPRCLADAQSCDARGCLACTSATASRAAVAGTAELLVRAGLTGLALSYVGGWIATQYVRVHLMSLAAPAVVGLAAGWLVPVSARRLRPAVLAGVAAVAALLGTALGFALTPGGENPLRQWGVVGGPYLAALIGVGLGPLLLGAPRRDRDRGDASPAG